MWKIIILLAAAYFLYRMFANDFLKKRKEEEQKEQEEMERKKASGEMAKDPECGTYVDMESAISVRDGDKNFYFCSYECRDQFLKKLKEGGRHISLEKQE